MDKTLIDDWLFDLTEHEQLYLENLKRYPHLLNDLSNVSENDFLRHGLSLNVFNPTENKNDLVMDFKKHSRFRFIHEHNHEYIEMTYMYAGTMKQIINNKEIFLKKGDVIILDTKVKHQFYAAGKDDIMLSFIFSRDFFKNNIMQFDSSNYLSEFFLKSIFESNKYNRYLVISMDENRLFLELLLGLVQEFKKAEIESELLKTQLSMSIFILLSRSIQKTITPEDNIARSEEFIHYQLVEYIHDNLGNITLTEMSKHFGYHPNYLSKLIKKVTGTTFSEYLTQERLKNSLRLLRNTTLTIQEISEKSGFSNYSFFYKKFREHFSDTPKNYRNKFLK